MRPYSRNLMALTGLALLAACSGQEVKDTLGLDRRAPDEYRVVSRPPLIVPPAFELRPPLPGESEMPVLPADRLARALVTGETQPAGSPNQLPTAASQAGTSVTPVESSPVQSPGDAQFLNNAGATQADPAIRDKIVRDKAEDKKKEDSWYDNLNFMNRRKEEAVDPREEAERLRQQHVPVKGPSANDTAVNPPAAPPAPDAPPPADASEAPK